jgi:hypothetical protein
MGGQIETMKKHRVTYSRERIVLRCVCGCALLQCDDRQKMSGYEVVKFPARSVGELGPR